MSLIRLQRRMKQLFPLVTVFIAVFILGIFLSFNLSGTTALTANQAGGGHVFARINGEDVPMAEFAARLERFRNLYGDLGAAGVQMQAELPRYVYDQLVQEYAEAEAARAEGVSVAASEAQREAERRVDEQLQQMGQGATPDEKARFRQILLSAVDLESERRRLMAQRLREKLNREVQPVEVKVAHVLIRTDTRSEAAAEKLAQQVVRQARAGTPFERLVQQHSDDAATRDRGGVRGWVSAMPPAAPSDPKAKPNPEDARSFEPEFNAAALRLRLHQVSNPVKTAQGFHVIKAVAIRNYEPKDKESAKDPKKKEEAIARYRETAANLIASGLFAEYRSKVRVEPRSAWLRGFLLEEQAQNALLDAVRGGKAADPKRTKSEIIAAYTEALRNGEPAAGPALAYKTAQLCREEKRHAEAVEILQKWARRSGDPEIHFLLGESLMELKRKTEALQAFQTAMEKAYNNASVLSRLVDKFKALGRSDLAEQARAKETQVLAKNRSAKPAASTGSTSAEGDVVGEVTVRTGDIDPKTGKPKILEVTTTDAKGNKKTTYPSGKPSGK